MHRQNPKISCVVPVLNEESIIAVFLKKLNQTLCDIGGEHEIIVVDDGSDDQTVAKVEELSKLFSIKLLCLSRHFGKEAALMAGMAHAKGDVVILIDADFQHPLELISTFIHLWCEGYDMVYGIRSNRQADGRAKQILIHLFYWLMQRITNINIPANAGDFRLLDRKMVNDLLKLPEKTRFTKGLCAWIGYKSIGVHYQAIERAHGKTSWRFKNLTELALTGITSFSDLPLRIWSVIGFIISFVAFLYAIYIVTVTLLYGADLPGFPTLIVAIMFLGGIQLLSIGILGEYIARIFTEVKQRPAYLIEKTMGFEE